MSHNLVDIRSPGAFNASIGSTYSAPCAHSVKEIRTGCRWRNQVWSVAIFCKTMEALCDTFVPSKGGRLMSRRACLCRPGTPPGTKPVEHYVTSQRRTSSEFTDRSYVYQALDTKWSTAVSRTAKSGVYTYPVSIVFCVRTQFKSCFDPPCLVAHATNQLSHLPGMLR